MPFYSYKLYAEKIVRFYIGSRENIKVKLNEQHNAGRNISLKTGIPWIIKYTQTFAIRALAMKRETEIQNKKNRKYIE